MLDYNNFIVRPTTDAEKSASMPYITSSMMEAVNTCPRWGIINSVLNKRYVSSYRQMALEAGSLMHEVLSAINLWQVAVNQQLPFHARHHGDLLFGISRWKHITNNYEILATADADPRLSLEKLAYGIIATSEYHDDPDDRNRTVANIEYCALMLIEYWLLNFQRFNIYISDTTDPSAPIGIEHSLDVVFEIPFHNDIVDDITTLVTTPLPRPSKKIRFIGLADIVYVGMDSVTLGEYKTASSMNDAWLAAFQTRHQITGYNAALAAYFPKVSGNTIMLGSALPVTKTKTNVQHFMVQRDNSHTVDFLRTISFTQSVIDEFVTTPSLAPMFTHSCNRYFRPCGLLDFCTSPKEDQPTILEQMATAEELSPSETKAMLRRG